jgi:hypothetical protein
MKLSHPMPDMAIPALRRLEKVLVADCTCCGGDLGALVRRLIEPEGRPAQWQVWLQCLTCGRLTDGPLSLNDNFKWQSYGEWNPVLRENWEADRLRRFTAAAEKERQAHAAALGNRRAEYDLFLRTSPEWKQLRILILRRSHGICEACLKQPPVAVHHKTYAFGLLPPARLLEAVCQTCHDRYHTPGDDWCPIEHRVAAE